MIKNSVGNIGKFLMVLVMLIVASAIVSCTHTSDSEKQLASVRAIMVQQPDSALMILNELKENKDFKSFPAGMQAYWTIYYCYSLDKSYKDLDNNIPLEDAVEYFSDKKDSAEKMYSYYYLGKIQYARNEFAKSISSFISAVEIAKRLNDSFNIALVYRAVGDIYATIHNESRALKYYTLAYKSFTDSDEIPSQYPRYTLVDIAHAYNNLQDYDKSIEYAQRALNMACTDADTILIANCLEVLGCSFCGSKQYGKAIKSYNKIIELTGVLSLNETRNLSLAYVNTNQLDLAKSIVYKFVDNDSLKNLALYDYNRTIGNYKDALSALDIDVSLQNEVLQEALSQNVTGAVSDHYSLMKRIKESEANKHRLIWIIVLLVSSFIILGLWLYFRYVIRKKKALIEQNMLTAENLRQILEVKDSRLASAQDTISNLFATQFILVDELCSNYYECKGTSREKNKVYEKVVNLISGLGSDSSILNQMEEKINQGLDNLIANLRKDYPSLKDADIQLFIYLVMGFSPRAISVLISQKLEVVYNRKSSLKRKIKEGNPTRKDIYLRYFT